MRSITTKDKLYKKAKTIVLKEKNYSISYLQRNLEIGYNRAREIIELMKANGIITIQT